MENNPEFKYECGWNMKNLLAIGIWPVADESFFMKIRAIVSFSLITVAVFLPMTAATYIVWDDMDSMIQSLSTNVTMGMGIVKFIVLYYQKNVFAPILEAMAEDWKHSDANQISQMMVMASISRRISNFLIGIVHIVVMGQAFSQIYLEPDQVYIAEMNPRLAKGFIWLSYFPFEVTPMLYLPLWIGQYVGTLIAGINYVGYLSFISLLILHLCGQLSILQSSFSNFHRDIEMYEGRKLIFQKNLANIVRRHQKLINMAETINNNINQILLLELLYFSATFCFQGYVIITSLEKEQFTVLQLSFTVPYLLGSLMYLFIYCWIGDLLRTESSKIRYSYYECPWYSYSPEEVRSFMFIGYRSHQSLQITARKFSHYSLPMFLNVLKTSFGYLSMLRAVQQ